jgi:succinate dehydrogenase / fumarate reductase membrane anchor subunit
MSFQSPLGRFLGHGSAKEGAYHWWMQRVSAIALIPLTLWFVWAIAGIEDLQDQAAVVVWMSDAFNGIAMILLIIAIMYHSMLGARVVVEDYIHGATKVITMIILQLAHVVLSVAGIYSVIIISLGAG